MKITKIKVYQARIYFWIFFVLTKSPFFSGGFATGGWKLQMGWWQKCGNLWFDDCCHSDGSSWWNCRVILHVNCQSILFLRHKLELFLGLNKGASIKTEVHFSNSNVSICTSGASFVGFFAFFSAGYWRHFMMPTCMQSFLH